MGLMLLPLVFGIGAGSMLTGRIVSRTGLTTIFPSVGLVLATVNASPVRLLRRGLSLAQLPWPMFVCGLFMGTVMGVVQVTVAERGRRRLAGLRGGIRFSCRARLAPAPAPPSCGTVLFAFISLADPETGRVFAQLVQRSPGFRDRHRRRGNGPRRHRARLSRRLPHHRRVRGRRDGAGLVDPDTPLNLSGEAPPRRAANGPAQARPVAPTAMPPISSTSANTSGKVGVSPSSSSATATLTAGVPRRPSEVVDAGSSEELTAAAQ